MQVIQVIQVMQVIQEINEKQEIWGNQAMSACFFSQQQRVFVIMYFKINC